MYRIDDPSASATLPTPEAALTEGYWTEGNPGTGVPATLERASWFNMVQEELRAIVVAGGATPSKTNYTQIRDAIKLMFSTVVGTARNVVMSVTAASATATLTADEIIVETALGGFPFKLSSFSKTINLATIGAGGMDTGTAPTTGAVAIYAIYNPTTQTSALLATNASSVKQGNIYGGANMPTGYTASALVSVWLTTAASLFAIGYQQDRHVAIGNTNQIASSSIVTAQSQGIGCTANAVKVDFNLICQSTASSTGSLIICPNSSMTFSTRSVSMTAAQGGVSTVSDFPLQTGQTIWFSTTNSAGTPSFIIQLLGYTF